MNLPAYKEQLRLEILAIGNAYGVRKTCKLSGISLSAWYNIRYNTVQVETLEKYKGKIKKALQVSKN